MKTKMLMILLLTSIFLAGCAVPGKKLIVIHDLQLPEKTAQGVIGLAKFKDLREVSSKGYVGFRILMNGTRETYWVSTGNLSNALTEVLQTYLEKKGYTVHLISAWEPDINGIIVAGIPSDQMVGASIETFECKAKKKGFHTDLTLTIDMNFYYWEKDKAVNKRRFKSIPVALTLERSELTFSKKKFQTFINQSFQEVIQKTKLF